MRSYSMLKTQYSVLVVIITTLTLSMLLVNLANPPIVNAFGLKIAPLKYEEYLELGSEKTGFVDVSNPSDFDVTVSTDVKAFRQIDIEGNLEFYRDEQIARGIRVDVNEFSLGPREAARIFFHINSNDLPAGGVYAVVFFAVDSQPEAPEFSSVATTTRVGTLLILENGDQGVRRGRITSLELPFWQFGQGLSGSLNYEAEEGELAIAFNPGLELNVPLIKNREIETGLVFPGNTREFTFEVQGNYLGLLPIKVVDETTGSTERVWVLAVTGLWRPVLPLLLVAIGASLFLHRHLSARKEAN